MRAADRQQVRGGLIPAWLGTPIYPDCCCVFAPYYRPTLALLLWPNVLYFVLLKDLQHCFSLFCPMLLENVTLSDDKTFYYARPDGSITCFRGILAR
jgi:hypothetical protein